MKMNLRKSIFVMLFCAGVIGLHAQTAQEILQKAREAWTVHEHLSLEVDVKLYEKASSPATLLGTAVMRKSGSNYYSKFLDNEMLSTASGAVILDHTSRQITWLPDEGKRRRKQQFEPQIDSISPNDSVVYLGLKDNVHQLEIYHRSGYITKTVFQLSASTFLPEKVVYYYAPANEEDDPGAYKSELVYKNISFEPVKSDLFSEKKYIVRSGDAVKPAPAYASYKVIAAKPHKQ